MEKFITVIVTKIITVIFIITVLLKCAQNAEKNNVLLGNIENLVYFIDNSTASL